MLNNQETIQCGLKSITTKRNSKEKENVSTKKTVHKHQNEKEKYTYIKYSGTYNEYQKNK